MMGENRYILSFIVITIVLTFLTNCSYNQTPKTIDMDYIKTPDAILLSSYIYKDQISKLSEELKQIEVDKNSSKKQEIVQKINELIQKSTIYINDKDFIKTLMNDIYKSKGIQQNLIIDKTVSNLFYVQFVYKDINNTPFLERFKEGYISGFSIFSNGYAQIPKYDKNARNNTIFLMVKLSDKTIKYLENYYNSKLKESIKDQVKPYEVPRP